MKPIWPYLFFCCTFFCRAQQTIIYTQYPFNKAGINPAASGTEINRKYNFLFGLGRQWVGLANPPQQNFANFSMTIRPPRSYSHWQNIGVYIDNETSGVSGNNGLYANYTFHMLVSRSLVLSFGAYAGFRSFYISSGSLDRTDPLIQRSVNKTLLYPDIIPGFRMSSRKFFMDLSARQLSITQLKDFKGRKIGGPSQLEPTIFVGYGRLISLNDFFLLVPCAALNTGIISAPNVDVNAMVYYNSRFGAGAAIRNLNFASAIVQIRVLKNLAIGLAYSYPLNDMKYAAPNSFEIMVGMPTVGMITKASGKRSIARCPALDF